MKSPHRDICCQLYLQTTGFGACYTQLHTKGDSLGEAIYKFVHDFGAPEHPTFDGFGSQVGKNTILLKNLRKYSIKHHIYAPQHPNEKSDEGAIR